jgi:hypothetical protein
MPTSYTILPDLRLVLSRGWGIVTDEDLFAHAAALREDPRFLASFNQIADFRDVTEVRVTSGGVRRMTELNPFGQGARRAIVAPGSTAFGLSRMYELMKSDTDDEVMVVREIGEALKWLADQAPTGWQDLPPLKPDWTSESGPI